MTANPDLLNSESVQDFLKAVYALEQLKNPQKPNERVSTNAIAATLRITAPSVTDMARRLQEAGLLDYAKYKGMVLTEEGEALALKIIRRHRLIETYLVQELGYALHEVHDEAEQLEHSVSDRFVEAVDAKLNYPAHDPHGDPIPSADGLIPNRELQPLTEWPLNTSALVSRIKTSNDAMIQHITERGFNIGSMVEILSRDPFNGPVVVMVDDAQQIIGHNVAACILVEDL